jgi:hypothetical protein
MLSQIMASAGVDRRPFQVDAIRQSDSELGGLHEQYTPEAEAAMRAGISVSPEITHGQHDQLRRLRDPFTPLTPQQEMSRAGFTSDLQYEPIYRHSLSEIIRKRLEAQGESAQRFIDLGPNRFNANVKSNHQWWNK